MSNIPAGSTTNIIVAPARLLVAPLGTALPTLDGTQNPVVFGAGWKEVGFTDQGLQFQYQPSVKGVKVDEIAGDIKKILDDEKIMIACTFAEATMTNLNRAISASILTQTAADATHAAIDKLEGGNGSINEVMVAFEGLNQAGLQRLFFGWRSVAEANVSMAFKRNDKTVIPVTFGLMPDVTKTAGKQSYAIYDLTAPHS